MQSFLFCFEIRLNLVQAWWLVRIECDKLEWLDLTGWYNWFERHFWISVIAWTFSNLWLVAEPSPITRPNAVIVGVLFVQGPRKHSPLQKYPFGQMFVNLVMKYWIWRFLDSRIERLRSFLQRCNFDRATIYYLMITRLRSSRSRFV